MPPRNPISLVVLALAAFAPLQAAASLNYDATGTLQAVKRFTPSNEVDPGDCYYTCPPSFVGSVSQETYTLGTPPEGFTLFDLIGGGTLKKREVATSSTLCGYNYGSECVYSPFVCIHLGRWV